MIIRKYLFLLGIFIELFGSIQSVFYDTIKGSFLNAWNINITFFVIEFKGHILYMVDSGENAVSFVVDTDTYSKNYIDVVINDAFSRYPTNHLCGCDPCNNQLMNLYISVENGKRFMKCNGHSHNSLNMSKTKKIILPLILPKLENKTDSILVGMGNIIGSDNLIGCLESFFFNNTRLNFQERGKDFLSTCEVTCSPDICNKGKCGEKYPYGPICDCKNTALNGRYCNKQLREYKRGLDSSFKQKQGTKQIEFKLSWKPFSSLRYCLMDFIYESGNFTLIIDGKVLMERHEVVTIIRPDEINFVTVNITESRVNIKISNKTFTVELTSLKELRINIGFSEKITDCNTFHGKYDLHFNHSQLVKLVSNSSNFFELSTIWIMINVFFVFVVISLILAVLYSVKLRRNLKTSRQNEETNSVIENQTEMQSI